MKSFILSKIEIINREKKQSGNSLFFIVFRKIVRVGIHALITIFDLCVLFYFVPFIIISLFVTRNGTKKKSIFFIGLEHVINKTIERAITYKDKGYTSSFYSFEWSGMKHALPFNAKINKYSFLITIDTLRFCYHLIKERPCYVEVYFEGNCYRQFFAVLMSKLYGCVVVSIERGVWHGFKEHNVPFLLGLRYIVIFKLSDKIFYRELGLFEIYDRYKLDRNQFYFDYNKVTIREEPIYYRDRESQEVLYLNGFKSFRRLDLLIKSIPIVRKAIPNVKFKIVGARSEADMIFANRELKKINVADIAEVFSWNPNPDSYYKTASVFVLPAELVFCNFSLIEAMERGVPPVVTKVEDADKIIEDGVDGVLCAMTENAIADAIIALLLDETKRERIARGARNKVIRDFNSAQRLDPIIEIIERKIFSNGH